MKNVLVTLALLPAVGCTSVGTQELPREGFVTVEPGVRIAYSVVGSGPETLVVPWPSVLTDLDRLASGRRLVIYNPRGRVASDPVEASKVSFENELSDLDAVRTYFGLERMMLLGWSHYGMMTAVYIPMGGSREWVQGNPNARLLVIEGAGHFPHVEKPEVYFPAVEKFLSGSWPKGAVTIPPSTVIPSAARDLSQNGRDSSALRASE